MLLLFTFISIAYILFVCQLFFTICLTFLCFCIKIIKHVYDCYYFRSFSPVAEKIISYRYLNLKWRIWLPWIIQPIVLKKWNWKQWYIIDAAEKPLGRVAAEAAKLLRGKHKPTYTPNIDVGDHVIIINCEKVVLTGRKLDQKFIEAIQDILVEWKKLQLEIY